MMCGQNTLKRLSKFRGPFLGIIGLVFVIAASIVLMQPLSEELDRLRAKSMVLRLMKTLPVTHPHIFERTVDFDILRVRDEDGVLLVHIEGTVPRDKADGLQERLELFRDELEKKAGDPVIIEAEVIPIDIMRYRVVPHGDNKQGANQDRR